ncbi:MAG: hypothetical protein ACYTFN_14795 [Planctomycetota bacterium]|jgi:hypothetical protein
MKRAEGALPPKEELQARHRGDCLGVASDPEALEALALAERRRTHPIDCPCVVCSWIENPPSDDIAVRLTEGRELLCCHDRNPCYLRCGVRKREPGPGTWTVIGQGERRAWFEKVLARL